MAERTNETIAARLDRATQGMGQVSVPTGTVQAGEDEGDRVLDQVLPGQSFQRIPVDLIGPAPEGQARQDFNEETLSALAESLKRSGVREPIIVTPHGAEPGHFQIVAGERRWRAARLAGLTEVPCVVDPGLAERKDKLLAQAEENMHRENLNPLEEAAVLAQLMEARSLDAGKAGALLGKSERQARRLVQLHGAAAPIKRAVVRGQLDPRVAVEMVRIYNRFAQLDETPNGGVALRKIETLIQRFVREGWTMRRLELIAGKVGAKGGQGDGEEEPGQGAATAKQKPPRPPLQPQPPNGVVVVAEVPVLQRRQGQVIIDAARVEQGRLTSAERAELIVVLEDLLIATRRA